MANLENAAIVCEGKEIGKVEFARRWNAVVASGGSVKDFAEYFGLSEGGCSSVANRLRAAGLNVKKLTQGRKKSSPEDIAAMNRLIEAEEA